MQHAAHRTGGVDQQGEALEPFGAAGPEGGQAQRGVGQERERDVLVRGERGALVTPTPVFLVRTLGAPPGVAGVLTATEGVGSPLGAALTPRPNSRFGSARALLVAPVVRAAPVVLLCSGAHGLLRRLDELDAPGAIRRSVNTPTRPTVLQSDSRTKRRPASSSRGSACA
ncbi:hypothetical protein [Kitasatospora griseola]|uniref:hypothetical protein n=1 Tax=Kitasatospora griseola TaxID=2064 RepID=UPI003663AE7A